MRFINELSVRRVSKITSLNPTVFLSLSLQMLFSVLQYFSPVNTDIIPLQTRWPSQAIQSGRDIHHLPWKAENSSLQEVLRVTLLPPLNGVLTPISPLPQAVISSYLEATKKEGKKKTQCLLLALILFLLFSPVQHCIHTWSLQGHKDTEREKKNKRRWDKMVCPQKKKNNYTMVKTIKDNLEQNCKHIGI